MRPSLLAVAVVVFCAVGFYGYSHGAPYLYGKGAKQGRREVLRSKRRSRKDERLRAKKAARGQAMAAKRAEMTEEQKNEQRERIRMQRVEQYQKLEEAQRSGVRVVVDLAFAVDQTTRERHSILKQLGCVYGYLKICPLDQLLSLHLASCTRELAAICAQHGVPSWKVLEDTRSHSSNFMGPDELVYLSPDSDNVLETLDPGCVYIVGAIVDRSVRKGESKSKASAHGIRTARLPLQEHFQQSGTRVRTHIMNLDSVIITLNEVANHGDWGRAFQRAVPRRITRNKGAKNQRAGCNRARKDHSPDDLSPKTDG